MKNTAMQPEKAKQFLEAINRIVDNKGFNYLHNHFLNQNNTGNFLSRNLFASQEFMKTIKKAYQTQDLTGAINELNENFNSMEKVLSKIQYYGFESLTIEDIENRVLKEEGRNRKPHHDSGYQQWLERKCLNYIKHNHTNYNDIWPLAKIHLGFGGVYHVSTAIFEKISLHFPSLSSAIENKNYDYPEIKNFMPFFKSQVEEYKRIHTGIHNIKFLGLTVEPDQERGLGFHVQVQLKEGATEQDEREVAKAIEKRNGVRVSRLK